MGYLLKMVISIVMLVYQRVQSTRIYHLPKRTAPVDQLEQPAVSYPAEGTRKMHSTQHITQVIYNTQRCIVLYLFGILMSTNVHMHIYNYIRTNWLNKMYRNEPILKKVRIKLVYTWNVEKDWVWDGGMFQSKTWDLGTDIWATWLPGRMPRGVEHGKAQNHPCRTVKIHSCSWIWLCNHNELPRF